MESAHDLMRRVFTAAPLLLELENFVITSLLSYYQIMYIIRFYYTPLYGSFTPVKQRPQERRQVY